MTEHNRDLLIAHLQFAYGLAQDGNFDRARTILDHCATQTYNAATQADVAFYRGLIARELGDLEEAAMALAAAQADYEATGEAYQAGVTASYRGCIAADAGYLDWALDHHHTAFQHFLAATDLVGIGNELARIGLILHRLQHHQEALECFEQALEAHQAAGDQRNILLDRLNLASIAQELEQRSLAQKHAETARTVAQQLDDLLGQTRVDYLLAGLAADAGNLTEAMDTYLRAHRQAESLEEPKLLADVTLGLGLTHYALGELADAGEVLAAVLQSYIQLQDKEGQATALANLGLVHLANGDLGKAEGCFETAIELQQARGDEIAVARQQGNLGLVLRAKGRWGEAEEAHRQALQVLETAGEVVGQATQWVNLASVAYLRGHLNEAEVRYQRALSRYKAVNHRQGQADVLANLGNIAHARSQWELALSYYQQGLTLYRQIGHRRGEAGALANTGVIYRELGRWEEAIRYYEQAIALDRTSGDRPGEAGTLNNLALTRRLVGDFASALADLDRALMLYQTIGDQRGQAATLDNLGLLHQDAGQPSTAVDYHEQALTIYRTLGLRAGLMSSLGNLGNALAALGKAEAALHHFDQALAIARELNDGDAEARLRVGRGDLYRLQGDLNAARVDYEAALSLIEAQRLDLILNVHRESFLGRERQPVYARLVRLLVQQGVIQRAWQVCEQSRSRTLLDQLAQSHWPRPAGVDNRWWENVRTTVEGIRILIREEPQPDDPTLAVALQRQSTLADARDRLEKMLSHAPSSATPWRDLLSGQPISWKVLCNSLVNE